MDLVGEERGRLARAATWLQATRAELVGLLVLLAGSVGVTGVLWWSAAGGADAGDGAAAPEVGTSVGADDLDPDGGLGDGLADGPPDDAVDGDHAANRGAAHDEMHGDVGGHTDPEPAGGPDHHEDAHEELTVHVSGAVASPGVITVSAGARVGDAVEVAGGPADDAETDLLNLAQPLTDGERVHVPREGETPPPVVAAPDGAGGGGGGEADAEGPIDLNRASAEQLETLPGIGPARAQAIVEHRETHGGFDVPGDLREVSGIGEVTFQRLADLVTAS